MASIYAKAGRYYAPDWTHPLTGAVVGAHSLHTGDREEAARRWELEKARAVLGADGGVAQSAAQRAFNPMVPGSTPGAPTPARVRFTAAATAYLDHIRRDIKPATLASYESHVRQIVAQLGDVWIDTLDTAALGAYAEREAKRLGRTHTVVKRFESLIKPTLRFAVESGTLARLPAWPRLRSDYRASGARKDHLSREQYAALRIELPEMAILTRGDGQRIVVYPRLWLDLAVTTGMHDSDIDRFTGGHVDLPRRLWLRTNSKGDAHHRPEWLPIDAYMESVLLEAFARRKIGEGRLLVAELDAGADGELPAQWMRRRLTWAAHRAGIARVQASGPERARRLSVVSGFVPSPNDLRRTFATWRRAEGWEFEETARWLANSSGMVREVYAQAPPRQMVRAVSRSRAASAQLIKLTRALAAQRKGPRPARAVQETESDRSESRSNITHQQELTHGKQTLQGGGPTD